MQTLLKQGSRFSCRKGFFYLLRLSCFFLLLSTLIFSVPLSRTWYIKSDGSGDAPSIQAGIASSIEGDSVLVAPGEYNEIIFLKQGICLISELGPSCTKIIVDPDPDKYFVIFGDHLDYGSHRTEVNGFWVEGVTWGILGAISLWNCENTWILNNILTNNSTGLAVTGGHPSIIHNTFYGNIDYGIQGAGEGVLMFNIIWDRAISLGAGIRSIGNDFLNFSDASPYEINNFSLDPEFCGAEAGYFFLQSDSPCAPGNQPIPATLIGALPVGCGTTSVEQKTWGEIKAIYAK